MSTKKADPKVQIVATLTLIIFFPNLTYSQTIQNENYTPFVVALLVYKLGRRVGGDQFILANWKVYGVL